MAALHPLMLFNEFDPVGLDSIIRPILTAKRVLKNINNKLSVREQTDHHQCSVTRDKDKFQISLDVQHFSPEEITVKTVNDDTIVIEGKHEEKQDEHGYVSRQFKRRYVIPPDHDVENVVSSLSIDGILSITAPKRRKLDSTERIVPITCTGPAKLTTKRNEKDRGSENAENKEKKSKMDIN